jgi:hypothetical protein
MAAATAGCVQGGSQVRGAENRSIITAAETNQLKTTPGRVSKVMYPATGTTFALTIYDDAAANNNAVYTDTAAVGVVRDLDIPMAFGIRVVTTGTPGSIVVTWS